MAPKASGEPPRRRSARLSAGREDMAKENDPDATRPFRFLNLPAEIRNSIYSYSFTDGKGKSCYNLFNFTDPAIALVSRQTRSESLPVLYSDARWIITVGGNYIEPHQWRTSGSMGVKLGSQKSLRLGGGAAVFRDVEIRVCPRDRVPHIRPRTTIEHAHRSDVVATLSIKTHPKLEHEITRGGYFIRLSRHQMASFALDVWRTMFFKEVDATLEAATAAIEKVCKREGFKGLTLKDVDKIAKAFRIMPDQQK